MYLEIFLADLAVFRVFVGISRVRNCTKYQKPCQKTNFPKCYSIDNHCSSDFFSRAGEKGRGFHIVYKEEIVNYYIKFFSWGGEGWGLRGGEGGSSVRVSTKRGGHMSYSRGESPIFSRTFLIRIL